MKTYHIKELLKKEVLILELPEGTADFSIMNTGDRTAVCAFNEYDECLEVHGISIAYTLLGSPDEIKESDARELVESWESVAKDGTRVYDNYHRKLPMKRTATESLLSAIETKIFWVNPYKITGMNKEYIEIKDWDKNFSEAESRTFDRNRSIILVKNQL